MFDYRHLQLRYEPFPIGLARPLMDPALYEALLDAYPAVDRFAQLDRHLKYSLSEKNHGRAYRQFVRANPVWREFHRWVKSRQFLRELVGVLLEQGIDLGYERLPTRGSQTLLGLANLLRGRIDAGRPPLSARFEFSMLPAQGGFVIPHSDAPAKRITLVISMVREGEWDPAWGGGTEVSRPKDPRRNYNELNAKAEWDEVEPLETYAFEPNQAVLFIKTFNSWHCVRPMTGPADAPMRRTLTINVETAR